MYRLDREDFVRSPYVSLWSILGFQAGFINAFGFLACERYVSHVTGFGTQIGIALAQSKVLFAIELLGMPASFIMGAFLSGLVTSARIEQKLKPRFDLITAVFPLAVLLLLLLGRRGMFGPFSEQFVQVRDFVLLFLLSFVCGMQNGCFAVLTKGQIRTTHLTGISTDIGTDLARIWFGKLNPKELELTKRVNFSRIVTFLSFATGSVVSVEASQKLGYTALVVPLATSVIIFVAVKGISKAMDIRFAEFASIQSFDRVSHLKTLNK